MLTKMLLEQKQRPRNKSIKRTRMAVAQDARARYIDETKRKKRFAERALYRRGFTCRFVSSRYLLIELKHVKIPAQFKVLVVSSFVAIAL